MTKYKARIVVDTYMYIDVNSNKSEKEKERVAIDAFKHMLERSSDMCVKVTEMECINKTPPCTICGSDNTDHPKSQPDGIFKCISCGSLFVSDAKV